MSGSVQLEAALALLNASPVVATGTTAQRSLADRFGDIHNVLDEGADPTGVADSTAAIQAAFDKAIAAGGGTVFFPAGVFRTLNTLNISDAGLVNPVGLGANISVISLDATNRPIISLNECGTGRPNFHWSGLTLRYTTPATTSHVDSVAVAFKTGAGTPAFGYYNFSMNDIAIYGAYIGIGNRFGATPPNVWGFDWRNLRIHNFAFRAWDITNTGTGGGSPNSSLRNVYLLGRAGLTYTNSVAFWDCGDAYDICCLEVNQIAFNAGTGVVYLGGSRSGRIGPARFEAVNIAGGSAPAMFMVETHHVSLDGIVVGACEMSAGVAAGVLRVGTGALATLRNVQTVDITGAGVLVGALESSAGQVREYLMAAPDSGRWIRNGGYFAPRFEMTASETTVRGSVSLGGTPGAESLRVLSGASYNRRVEINGANSAPASVGTNAGDLALSPLTGIVRFSMTSPARSDGLFGYAGSVLIFQLSRQANGLGATSFADYTFYTGAGGTVAGGVPALQIAHVPLANRYPVLSGSNGGASSVSTNLGPLAITPNTPNISLNASTGSFGGATGCVFIANGSVVPGSNPVGGGILYVEGGALKYRGSSGTITTIANA